MSTKTVAEKLLIKPGSTVWSSDPSRLALVGPLPDGARESGGPSGADVALLWAGDSAALRAVLGAHDDTWSALRFRPLREGESWSP